jgi:hypothetical protein
MPERRGHHVLNVARLAVRELHFHFLRWRSRLLANAWRLTAHRTRLWWGDHTDAWTLAASPAGLFEFRLNRLCAVELQEFKATLPPLLSVAEEVLGELRDEAEKAEREFFAEWGLPREATGLSKRLDGIAAEIAHFREGLAMSTRQPTLFINSGAFENVTGYFQE